MCCKDVERDSRIGFGFGGKAIAEVREEHKTQGQKKSVPVEDALSLPSQGEIVGVYCRPDIYIEPRHEEMTGGD